MDTHHLFNTQWTLTCLLLDLLMNFGQVWLKLQTQGFLKLSTSPGVQSTNSHRPTWYISLQLYSPLSSTYCTFVGIKSTRSTYYHQRIDAQTPAQSTSIIKDISIMLNRNIILTNYRLVSGKLLILAYHPALYGIRQLKFICLQHKLQNINSRFQTQMDRQILGQLKLTNLHQVVQKFSL